MNAFSSIPISMILRSSLALRRGPHARTHGQLAVALLLSCATLALRAEPPVAANSPEFRFLFSALTVTESDPLARAQVSIAQSIDHPVHVDFATVTGTALPGADYTPVTGTLIFQPGEHLKVNEIPILNDGLAELVETFQNWFSKTATHFGPFGFRSTGTGPKRVLRDSGSC
jgi:hypothetical protein